MHQPKELGEGGRGWGVREERFSWGWEAGNGWTTGIKVWLPPGLSECVELGVGPRTLPGSHGLGTRLRSRDGGPMEGVSSLLVSGTSLSFHSQGVWANKDRRGPAV